MVWGLRGEHVSLKFCTQALALMVKPNANDDKIANGERLTHVLIIQSTALDARLRPRLMSTLTS